LDKGLVSIIIATYNSEATLPDCLASIRNQDYRNYEIIIVDNGSTDGTLAAIDPQETRLLKNKQNLGFSKANNQALAIAEGEFALFLNSDATIAPNFLSILLPYFERYRNLGAASAKILKPLNGSTRIIDSAGLLMEHWRLLPRNRGEGEIDRGQYDTTGSVFGVPGACALYRRAALESAASGREYMDEDFFAYYEDVDLSWRIRRRNWTVLYVPDAVSYHHRKGPDGKETFIQIKAFTNRYWCYLKNAHAADFLAYAPIAVPYEILRILKRFLYKPSWIRPCLAEWRLFSKMRKKRCALYVPKRGEQHR
jgi:GT2 family glycosyltransferase